MRVRRLCSYHRESIDSGKRGLQLFALEEELERYGREFC